MEIKSTVQRMHAGLLLAHQGGWDEIMLVAGPVLIFGGLLAVARRRAATLAAASRSDEPRQTPA